MSFSHFVASEATSSDSKKSTVFLVWGPPGAGKSTLLGKYPSETIFKNIDDIVQFNCAPGNDTDKYWECRKNKNTVRMSKYLNHLAITQHKNLAIETTGNVYGAEWPEDLKKQGFSKVEVMCVFVNTVDKIWNRIQNRDQLSVDYNGLVETYLNSYYKNMEILLNDPNIDNVTIYDNSDDKIKLLVSKNGDSDEKVSVKSQVYREWFQSILES